MNTRNPHSAARETLVTEFIIADDRGSGIGVSLTHKERMAETKRKGDVGQSVIMARLMLDGYKVAIPFGEDWRFDLIVLKEERLQRIQCKYVTSEKEFVRIPCKSSNNHSVLKYTPKDVDWIIAFDCSTAKIFYIPSSEFGDAGRSTITLRMFEAAGDRKATHYAQNYEKW